MVIGQEGGVRTLIAGVTSREPSRLTDFLARGEGVEPSLRDSESRCLPLTPSNEGRPLASHPGLERQMVTPHGPKPCPSPSGPRRNRTFTSRASTARSTVELPVQVCHDAPFFPAFLPVLSRPHAWPRSELGAGKGGVEPTAYGFGIRVVAVTSRPSWMNMRTGGMLFSPVPSAHVIRGLAGGIRTPAARSQSDRAAVEHYSQM